MALAGISVLIMTDLKRLLSRAQSWIVIVSLAMVAASLLLIPNPISARVLQVATGIDGSANLRAFVGYLGAYIAASSKSLWWGVGLGQVKFFNLPGLGLALDNTLPNAVAGTLAEFGLIGVLVRFAVEFYLFFRSRVYLSSFRLAMFVVAFIDQLTGSYTDDVQSYLLWFLAFYSIFPDANLCDKSKSEVSCS
jgi:hypothetical protein